MGSFLFVKVLLKFLYSKKVVVYLTNKLKQIIMKLTVNKSATVKELVNEALEFTKYSNDVEAMEYLNEVMNELKYSMSDGNFQVFKERINTMLNA